ncbi:MAG: alpha-L-fucosidase [Carboxylicivirga sp.]|nr:alpha-L-fucosidase [Carboxylicivirga sp.]
MRSQSNRVLLFCLLGLAFLSASCNGTKEEKKYEANWESVKTYPVPEWYRDAKFGIFIHWGPYSVPGWSDGGDYSEWYSTMMYRKPSFIKYHEANYGKLGEFGYKDFIPMFKADKFDADEWNKLFKYAGAKYVIPTAEHHDGFSMWDNPYSEWNSVRMGPGFDFIARMEQSVRKNGMKYGISYHRERHWAFYTDCLNDYAEDSKALPVILEEIKKVPAAADLYGPFTLSEDFMKDYKARFVKLCETYQPDFMWIDDAPCNSKHPEAPSVDRYMNKYHCEMITDYLNMSEQWGKPVYWNNKKWTRNNYPEGCGVDEKDYLKNNKIREQIWQSSGGMCHSYGYDRTEESADKYRTVDQLLETMIDVVSKNGNFLLDIGPKPDGTLSPLTIERLKGIGDWMQINGESIYGTRPFKTFGYDRVRFTQKDNKVYCHFFDVQDKYVIDIEELDYSKIKSIKSLDVAVNIAYELTDNQLEINMESVKELPIYTFEINL